MDPALPTTPTALLARVREVHRIRTDAEAELVELACAWADDHPDLDTRPVVPALGPDWVPDRAEVSVLGEADVDEDGHIPSVAWDASASFAAALGLSTQAGEGLIRDALVLRHRLPRLWVRVQAREVPAWRARRVAQRAFAQPADVTASLDEQVAPIAERVGVVTVDRIIDESMLRLHAEERELAQLEALDATYVRVHEASLNHVGIADATLRADWADLHDFDTTLTAVATALEPLHAQEPFDARRARALGVLADPAYAAVLLAGDTVTTSTPRQSRRQVNLFVHVTRAVLDGSAGGEIARLETATGGAGRPTLAQQVASWCGRPETELKVTKVIDLNKPVSVDRYEVGAQMATRTELREPTCVFPWCSRPTRRCDKDHVQPHADGGQTCDDNLAPLCRRHHRLKTHTPWTYEPVPWGGWRWTDPHGMAYLRDHTGTRPLDGRGLDAA